MRSRSRVIILAIVLFIGVAFAGTAALRSNETPTVRLSVATNSIVEHQTPILPATGGWPYSQRITYDWGLADRFGLNYELVPRVTGKGTLAALLEDRADIAVVGGTPLVAAIANDEDVLILALTDQSTRQTRLVVRANHKDDWFNYPIGALPGTTTEAALIAELDHAGKLDDFVNGKVDVIGTPNPATMLDSLIDGTTESAVLLLPQAELLTRKTPEQPVPEFVDITTPDLYEFTNYLVTTPNRWKANRKAIILAMQATNASRETIHEDPTRRLLEIHNYEAGETPLRDMPPLFWNEDEIVFDTDRTDIATALSREAEVMVSGRMIPAVPSFDNALSIVDEIDEAK